MLQITRLEYVHSKGFVHRSVKPSNFVMGLGKNVDQVQKLKPCSLRKSSVVLMQTLVEYSTLGSGIHVRAHYVNCRLSTPVQVHIIDFCKARRYCNAKTGTHNPYRENTLSSGAFYLLQYTLDRV